MSAVLTAKQQKKQRLLDQGVELLLNKGYHASGLKEILDAVQIPKGSFYSYFESKEHYAVAVIGHYIDPYVQRLSDLLNQPDDDGLTALRRYYDELIAAIEQNGYTGGCLLGNLMAEIGGANPICRAALADAVNRYRDLQQTALERGQQRGVARSDKAARDMADLLLNSWQGALLRMKIEQSTAPLQTCRRELLDNFFSAAAARR